MTTQNLWDAAIAVLREKLIAIHSLHQETRRALNRQPNFTSKTTGKRITTKKKQKKEKKK